MSASAIKVLYRLHNAGFAAYLVGGAVRDLLLGRRPKDFDIGTDARPQQVRQLFRNARLIGRRFRLARVVFAEEVVEVATFRRSPEPPEVEDGEPADVLAPVVEAGAYGTPEEDAWRRDFTVNGLFYNIADFSVIDYVGGLADLQAGTIRTIGEPAERFGEDPVRMMRAVEYAARLGFRLEERTAEAIAGALPEIRRAAPARIASELGESLRGGQAESIFRGLEEAGLLLHIVPEAQESLHRRHDGLLWRLLATADRAVGDGERLNDETLLALLFLPSFLDLAMPAGEGRIQHPELERVVREKLDPPSLRLALSHFRAHVLRNAFLLLSRLTAAPRSAKTVLRTLRHEAFPTAWQLAHLLAGATGVPGGDLALWEEAVGRVQGGQAPLEESATAPAGPSRRRRRRRGGRQRRPAPGQPLP